MKITQSSMYSIFVFFLPVGYHLWDECPYLVLVFDVNSNDGTRRDVRDVTDREVFRYSIEMSG